MHVTIEAGTDFETSKEEYSETRPAAASDEQAVQMEQNGEKKCGEDNMAYSRQKRVIKLPVRFG